MKAAVVGLGKIGLPLATQIAGRGSSVVGIDIDPSVVESVNAGSPPFPGEPGLGERLAAAVGDGRLVATSDVAEVGGCDHVVIVVPLVVDGAGSPDFGALDGATTAVGAALSPGTLVSYETTLPVHTTRDRLTPLLESASGFRSGKELFVCHSPERVSSGRVFADLRRYPKLVGGIDDASTARAVAFYEAVLEFDERDDLPCPNGVWDLGSAEAAELAKLAETTYRDLNIAFANELAGAAERLGLDVHPIIEACNSQPYSHIHRPGIAVGGHCIPVYPHLLVGSVEGFELPQVARRVNDAVAGRAVEALAAALGGLAGSQVVVLGLAYRGDVKEHAFSGTWRVVEQLEARGATVTVLDPLFADEELHRLGLRPHRLGQPVDAAVLQTDHQAFRALTSEGFPGVRVVFDGRRWLAPERWPGVRVLRIGDGTA